MLCSPPLCHPATHFLGSFSLRTGAIVVLAADFAYGVLLVVLHAVLLGQVKDPSQTQTAKQQIMPWWVQFADLDFGFGHDLLGLGDHANLVMGLVYGLVVLAICSYMLLAVSSHVNSNSSSLPSKTRCFTAFAHLQVVLFFAMSLVKLPKLCGPLQTRYLTDMHMECNVLWTVYLQNVVSIVVSMSLGTWVFGSFSFVLTYGSDAQSAIDRPEYRDSLAPRTTAWRGAGSSQRFLDTDGRTGSASYSKKYLASSRRLLTDRAYYPRMLTSSGQEDEGAGRSWLVAPMQTSFSSAGPAHLTDSKWSILPRTNPSYNIGRFHRSTFAGADWDIEDQSVAP